MIDTNVLFSSIVLNSPLLLQMVYDIVDNHTIVLSTHIIDELKRVTKRKFPDRYSAMEKFLQELPFELVYTPEQIDLSKYPDMEDKKNLPILVSAIIENVDVLISGDTDFTKLNIDNPEIMLSRKFVEKYL